jgi:hypothetical protein
MPSSIRLSTAFAAALVALGACSNSQNIGNYPDGGGGSWGNTDVAPGTDIIPSVFCVAFGQQCAKGADCCSGICDPSTLTCAASVNTCTAAGGACVASTECCSMSCSGGRCASNTCVADGQACLNSASCCGGNCSNGVCQALNPICRTAGNPCTTNAECCSQLCDGGVCKLGSSFCIQTGDVCSDSTTCCSGDCTKDPNAGPGALGVCSPPPSGATYCSDGVDGTVCGDCNNCCSRLCAPYGPTGVKVCQPASGCRVNGDLCRQTSDCCGAPGTGLPGDGNVVCQIESGKALGICRNPNSCNPQGNVCHYKDYTCSVSSARNNCCAGVGNSGVCKLDSLGVPRCDGLGGVCVPGGGICSSSMDCCDQMPCIPAPDGQLRCYLPPGGTIDGGTPPPACIAIGGSCTINGDCCKGLTCIQPLGSTKGTCGYPTTNPDGGSPDSPGPVCAEYGQLCTSNGDCCSNVPCTNGRCVYDIIIP